MKRGLAYLAYYWLGRHLPESTKPYSWGAKQVRRTLARQLLAECGKSVNIERGADFGSGRRIRLGDRSGLGADCRLIGDVIIGKDVMMGPGVLIMALNHEFADVTPMIEQGMAEIKKVVIDDDVWIGARAIILPGVHIAHGVVVGAGAVVSKDVPPYAVVVGNPARVVRTRTSSAERVR